MATLEVDKAKEGGGAEVHLLPRLDEKNEEEDCVLVTLMVTNGGDVEDDLMSGIVLYN